MTTSDIALLCGGWLCGFFLGAAFAVWQVRRSVTPIEQLIDDWRVATERLLASARDASHAIEILRRLARGEDVSEIEVQELERALAKYGEPKANGDDNGNR